jgi:hypothetical protein
MLRPFTTIARPVSTVLTIALIVVGCSTTATRPVVEPTSATPTDRPGTPAPTPTAAASVAAEPPPIDPGTVPAEQSLERLWIAKGPAETAHLGLPAIDSAGRIWALPAGRSEFWIFDRDGGFLESWGTAGAGEGQFDFSRERDTFGSVAFASDGSFYVAEAGNHRVQHFDADRHYLAQWGSFGTGESQFVSPNLLEVDGASNVYVHDDDLGVIKMFAADGTYVRTFPGSSPFFHVDGLGHVYSVNDDHLLREYAPDATVVRSIDLNDHVSFVSGIVLDAGGHLWVGSNIDKTGVSFPDRLLEFDADRRILHDWDGMAIDGLTLDPAGDRLYTGFFAPDILAAYALPKD